MSKEVEEKLDKIPIVNLIVRFMKRIHLPIGNGITLYDLIELYILGIIEGMFTYRSGSIAFSFFMALFPFLLIVLNLIPYVPINGFQNDFLNFVLGLLPPKTSDLFSNVFHDIANNKRVGLLSSVGLLCILLMSNGINAIFGSFEHSYHVKLTRTIIGQYMIAVGVALLMTVLLLSIVILFVYFQVYISPFVENNFSGTMFWYNWAEYIVFIGMTYFFTSILYYFGVRHEDKRRFFTPGATLTTILVIFNTYLFSLYINGFSMYNELYGSIGTVLILMLYIWLNANILLLGFELNASMISLRREKLRRSNN